MELRQNDYFATNLQTADSSDLDIAKPQARPCHALRAKPSCQRLCPPPSPAWKAPVPMALHTALTPENCRPKSWEAIAALDVQPQNWLNCTLLRRLLDDSPIKTPRQPVIQVGRVRGLVASKRRRCGGRLARPQGRLVGLSENPSGHPCHPAPPHRTTMGCDPNTYSQVRSMGSKSGSGLSLSLSLSGVVRCLSFRGCKLL